MKNITISFLLARTSSNYEDIHKTGVYKLYHINKPNVFYIGSVGATKGSNRGFKKRWREHLSALYRGKHQSSHLQRVINKYGLEGLRFEIIEYCLPEDCVKREQHWLDFYKPFGDNGYNACKFSRSSKGYKFPEEKKSGRKPICQYSIDGKFIKRWNSLNEASRELNINVSSIKDCCKKRFKQIKGFIFRYEEELDLPKPEEMKRRMQISCIYNNSIVCTGSISEILHKVPDKKGPIYKHLKSNTMTRNNYKYVKIINYGKNL